MGNNTSKQLYELIDYERLDVDERNELKRLISDYLKQKYVKDYIETFGIDSALKDDFHDYLKDWSSYKLYNSLFNMF